MRTKPSTEAPKHGRLIIGITGASGVVYGIRALEILAQSGIESHLVMSKAAEMTIRYETDYKPADVKALAHQVYPVGDVGASISSGSYRTLGMLITPCSVRTMSEIASGVTSSLLTRAADGVLKEQRRLVLMVREAPLHAGHLKSMLELAQMGAVITPPVPAFYTKPKSVEDIVDQTVSRALDLFNIEVPDMKRWGEDIGENPSARRSKDE